MLGNTLGNTRKYKTKKMKYFGIFTRLLFDSGFFIDWVLNYFTLITGIYEMSNRTYYEKSMKNPRKNHEIQGNTLPKT
jgi:hypothetical protein